jgi:hypothetical protein
MPTLVPVHLCQLNSLFREQNDVWMAKNYCTGRQGSTFQQDFGSL